MDANFNNENDPWEFGLDIDDSDLHLTPSLRSSNSTHVQSSTLIQNPVYAIPGPAGVVQLSSNTRDEPYPLTPNPVRIIPGPADLETMSMDDLYKHLKVYEPKVKGMSSSNSNTLNMAFLSSINSCTNKVVNTAQVVNTVNEVSTASTQFNTVDNLSDAVICAFLIVDNYKKGLRYESYNVVPPTYKGNFMLGKHDLSYTGLDEFDVKPVVENKSSEEATKEVRKNLDAFIVEEWVLDDEEDNVTQPKIVKKTIRPSIVKKKLFKPRQQE
nr:hypothetical protein [Tanacetum cinerariifolium]